MAFLRFIEVGDTGKTKLYEVGGRDVVLGQIKWFAPWRRYCFYPHADTLFDSSCLTEVNIFINTLMEGRKNERANR
jgi:hypothetical protein